MKSTDHSENAIKRHLQQNLCKSRKLPKRARLPPPCFIQIKPTGNYFRAKLRYLHFVRLVVSQPRFDPH